jgi:hypothetical protein
MKKYLLIFGFLILGFTSHSQLLMSLIFGDKLNSEGIEFGLEGGLNFTTISGFETHKSLGNFNLGFYFDIRMKDQFYLHTGVQGISSFGMRKLTENDLEFLEADIEDYEGKYKQKVYCFLVPILANYKFKNHIYVEAGPQVGLLYDAWVQFDSNENNKETRIKDYNDNLLNWFEGGVAVGAGYRLLDGKGMTIGVRYYQGLSNVFKYRSGTHQNSFLLKVNIPVGAGKAKEKKG